LLKNLGLVRRLKVSRTWNIIGENHNDRRISYETHIS